MNRPALALGQGPRSVLEARHWVIQICHDIARSDLTECAELGASELVTNALLHAVPPLSVRVRGTREHPRIEIRDGSTEIPVMPVDGPTDEADLMLTFGRGLGIVARCSTAWGVQVEAEGKTIWFVPATRPGDQMVEGVVSGDPGLSEEQPGHREASRDDVTIVVAGVPLRLFVEFQRHYRELRREVRLLALAHEADYPLARDLSRLFGSLERDLREGIGAGQIERALESGCRTTDLHVAMPRATAATVGRFIELLDLADAFCRQERLLSLARTPEQQQFQRWFLGEFVRQTRGESPVAWLDAPAAQRTSVS